MRNVVNYLSTLRYRQSFRKVVVLPIKWCYDLKPLIQLER